AGPAPAAHPLRTHAPRLSTRNLTPSPFFLQSLGRPPRSPLFPYTTLFRSERGGGEGGRELADGEAAVPGEDGRPGRRRPAAVLRSEEHTSELQSLTNLVCRLLLEKKKNTARRSVTTAQTAGGTCTRPQQRQ